MFAFQLAVKIDQHFGLLVVNGKAFFDGFFFVVVALNQIFAGYVVFAFDFGRIVGNVVGAAGSQVDAAAAHAVDNHAVRYVDFNHGVQIHACFNHRFGLCQRAREAVKQETVFAVVLRDAFFHHANDDVVAYQAAFVNDFFRFQTQRRACFNRSAEHVAGGNLRNAERSSDELSLSAFARARRA